MQKNTQQLNKRQDAILYFIEKNGDTPIALILNYVNISFPKTSKITVNRDIKKLISNGFMTSKGKARAVTYDLSPHYNLIKPIDVEKYFQTETDKRIVRENFNFDIFSFLKNIFTESENNYLGKLNSKYQENIKKLSPAILKKEYERLTIELSWKSSQIEGNTYTLLETESLIKENIKAKGHEKDEAIMILNHKATLDHIFKNKNNFKKIALPKIEYLHYLLIKDLGIPRNIRKTAVGITGTKYRPIGNEFQIRESMEKTCILINKEKNPFAKALLLSAMIAYIQPFEDGNKRTSRLSSNALLAAHNICPLSYRSVDEMEYKKAVILFYEQNNISYFKRLFIEQFEFAVNNYFLK